MTNKKKFSIMKIGDFLTTQLGMDSNLFYIGLSSLKNLNREIGDANLKKIGYPNLLAG
jgi:hypothetical protein